MLLAWLHRHPIIVDWVLAGIAFATMLGTVTRPDERPIAIPFAVLACLPLVRRRQNPVAVLAITTALTIVMVAIWGAHSPLPAGLALYTVADKAERRTSLSAGAIVLVLIVVASSNTSNPLGALARGIPFVIAWLAGDSIGTRRRYVAALEERAERLERERVAEAARAAAEEQARIARELHDVIAHNVSVMVVQAAAANDVFESRPARAREALRSIETTGRSALAELRRLLGVVRDSDPTFTPQPGLARLEDLVAPVRAAGLEVVVTVDGTPRALPPSIDLSAYRVVQEALTNTLKHARATHVDVALHYRDDALGIEVRDDGSGSTDPDRHDGRGLIGMRERVGIFGGSLVSGPGPDGGFAVSARFPIAGAA
jgi:signal transduction histidine kinase